MLREVEACRRGKRQPVIPTRPHDIVIKHLCGGHRAEICRAKADRIGEASLHIYPKREISCSLEPKGDTQLKCVLIEDLFDTTKPPSVDAERNIFEIEIGELSDAGSRDLNHAVDRRSHEDRRVAIWPYRADGLPADHARAPTRPHRN